MSKPTQKENESVQARARAAAVRLFSRHGFEGTSVQAIADEVGISKQALLYHFSSKEGLREAAIAETVEMWRAALPRFLAAMTRSQGRFDEALSEILDFFRAEPAFARFLMQELLSGARHPSVIDIQGWLGFASEYIRQARDEGMVASDVDPEAWVVNTGTFILAALSLMDPAGPGHVDQSMPDETRLLKELARMIGSSLGRTAQPPSG